MGNIKKEKIENVETFKYVEMKSIIPKRFRSVGYRGKIIIIGSLIYVNKDEEGIFIYDA